MEAMEHFLKKIMFNYKFNNKYVDSSAEKDRFPDMFIHPFTKQLFTACQLRAIAVLTRFRSNRSEFTFLLLNL